jgi:competence protein ComEC
MKEIAQAVITSGQVVSFNFTKNATSIESIHFISTKSVGKTTAIVEALLNNSTLVSKMPDAELYNSFNVWVGNAGYGNSESIKNASVSFKVNNIWIQANDINQSSIALNKWDANKKEWKQLPTNISGNDSEYLHLVAEVPGFSSFVITGEIGNDVLVAEPVSIDITNNTSVGAINLTGANGTVSKGGAAKKASMADIIGAFLIIAALICCLYYFYMKTVPK